MDSIKKKLKPSLFLLAFSKRFSSEGNQKFTTFLKRERLKWI